MVYEVLPSGQSHPGRLVRIGERVHRPTGAYSAAVHGFLLHLERTGFAGAPRFHGLDGEGREILDYVQGEVPRPPVPGWAATDEALESVARLLRRLHDASEGYVPEADAPQHEPPPPATWSGTLVGHNDLVPDNVVFRDGSAVAFIDFDLCAPVDPLWDVAVALRHWLPIRDEADLEPAHLGTVPGHRFALFCAAYGLADEDRPRLLDAMLDCCVYADGFVRFHAGRGVPAWVTAMAEGRCERHQRSARWLHRNRDALLGGSG
ncbi:phosphotransferase [Actinocorallia longicatena]|uniref:Aminoglycoside phosphotransferase family protein n=1 Tax=Actinocorallia longicatena TaxID=111803 RepID=A0ABP6QPC3_9ACTN